MNGWSDAHTIANRNNQLQRRVIYPDRTDNPRPLIHREGVRKYKDENYVWNISRLRRCPKGSRRHPRSSHICLQFDKVYPIDYQGPDADTSTHFNFGETAASLQAKKHARNEPDRLVWVRNIMEQARQYDNDGVRRHINAWLRVGWHPGLLTPEEYNRLRDTVIERRQQLRLPPLPQVENIGFDYRRSQPGARRGRPRGGIGRRRAPPAAANVPVAGPAPPPAPVAVPPHIPLSPSPSFRAPSPFSPGSWGGLDDEEEKNGEDAGVEEEKHGDKNPPPRQPIAPAAHQAQAVPLAVVQPVPVAPDAPLRRKVVNPFGLVGGVGQRDLYIAQQHQIMRDLMMRNARRSARLNPNPQLPEPDDPRRRSARRKKK